jgi:hypothetical protein
MFFYACVRACVLVLRASNIQRRLIMICIPTRDTPPREFGSAKMPGMFLCSTSWWLIKPLSSGFRCLIAKGAFHWECDEATFISSFFFFLPLKNSKERLKYTYPSHVIIKCNIFMMDKLITEEYVASGTIIGNNLTEQYNIIQYSKFI